MSRIALILDRYSDGLGIGEAGYSGHGELARLWSGHRGCNPLSDRVVHVDKPWGTAMRAGPPTWRRRRRQRRIRPATPAAV